MMELPDGWPPRFKPSEWDCYDKRGSMIARGALVAPLPLKGWIHENARRCAWNLNILQLHLGHGDPAKAPSIRIISGWRPEPYNAAIGGAKKSKHVPGLAADFVVGGHSPRAVARMVEKLIANELMEKGGFNAYSSFCHYDPRGYNARW